MTTISTDIALGVMNSIQKLYLRHELVEDFIIEIENTEIKCFRFILESCSEFFSGLFRSGMKEVTNGRATLHGISCETFKLIREAMYTGIDVVTEDNAIAIWHASNQLQIDFMIELCEKMVVKMLSLDNFEEVYRNAKLINSKHVLGQFKTFISEHFVQIRKMNTFLELSYDDVLALISDDKLVVESEDQVLESIMEWIEHPVIEKLENEHQNDKRKCTEDIRERSQAIAKIVAEKNSFVKSKLTVVSSVNIEQSTSDMDAKRLDNDNRVVHKGVRPPPHVQSKDISPVEINEGHDQTDSTGTKMLYQTNDALQQLRRTKRKFAGEREPKLVPLLNAARTCLATSAFLESLYNHHLIKENCKAKDIIFNAVLHHTEKYRNGRWSEAALHRECSAFGNFGVVSHGNGVFEAYSTVQDVFFKIARCPECYLSVHLVVFDNELYACGRTFRNDTKSKLFLFRGNVWTKVTELKGPQLFLLSYENTILLLNGDNKKISSINPKESYKIQKNLATLPDDGIFEYALIYERQLLVFLAENVQDIAETAVYCLDLMTKFWTRLDNLDGPAQHLISFQDGENHYIIQSNGNLWRFVNAIDKLVSFHFIGKLWTDDRIVHGAVPYKDRLTLFGDDPSNYPEDAGFAFKDFPYSLRNWGVNGDCSNFLPVTLAKSCLISLNE